MSLDELRDALDMGWEARTDQLLDEIKRLKKLDEPKESKTYIYVLCEMKDGLPSFRHLRLRARDEMHAYALGQAALKTTTGINNYVVEL